MKNYLLFIAWSIIVIEGGQKMYTMGIDVGSASSKVVILKDGKDVVAAEVVQVGTGSTGPKRALEQAFQVSGLTREDMDYVVATGYGRFAFEGADKQISEIMQKGFTIWYQLHAPSLILADKMQKQFVWITRVVSSSFL